MCDPLAGSRNRSTMLVIYLVESGILPEAIGNCAKYVLIYVGPDDEFVAEMNKRYIIECALIIE